MRYGIIGSGMMGQEHIRNIALLEDARVVAVADPHDGMRDAARALAGPDCAGFEDPAPLLDGNLCDALVIATPNDTHFDLLRSALSTDLPILIEKPLCTTLDECRTIEALGASRRAPVWVAMEYRYMPPVARLINAVRAGTAGRVRMLSIREHRFPFLAKVGDWNRFADRTGGTLVEKCCHFFDLMRLILGARPVRVFASGGMDVNFLDETYEGRRPDILDNAYVVVDFDGGARAMLDLCMFAEGSYWQEEISVTGDRARIDARVPGPARFSADGAERHSEIVVSPRDTKRPVHDVVAVDETILSAGDHHGSTFYQHQRFQRMVAEGGDPEVTLTDGMIAVAVGAAAEQSARSGQPVMLRDFGAASR
ncbi:MAG: Gfo/Idh/MocA family oxidoreductase [Pseudomonadota bacterium]